MNSRNCQCRRRCTLIFENVQFLWCSLMVWLILSTQKVIRTKRTKVDLYVQNLLNETFISDGQILYYQSCETRC